MAQPVDPALTPEERAQMMDIQDRLIELLVGRDAVVSSGDRVRADALQDQIDDLLRQRDEIKIWAAGGK